MAVRNFSISNITKSTLPHVPFLKIKEVGLGKEYDLSLVFVGNTESKKLNSSYRGKNYPTNVLSFPLSKEKGEIIIDLKKSKSEAKDFNRNFTNFVAFLFIHGICHLKGMEHGSTMDKAEEKLRKQFGI